MGIYTTRPIKELDRKEFRFSLAGKTVVVSAHTYDHLDEGKRKVFKDAELIHMVEKENARKIYLQENGRYAAYYRRPDGYRKLIIEIENEKTVIVSFMDVAEIPKGNLSK